MEKRTDIWRLIARSLSGELSISEQQDLEQMLREREDLQLQYEVLRRVWLEAPGSEDQFAISREDASKSVNRIFTLSEDFAPYPEFADLNVDQPSVKPRIGRWIIGIAASLIIFLTAGYFFSRSAAPVPEPNHPIAKNIATDKGSRTRTLLPDGSTVWLNAGSTLKFINDFEGKTREVELNGEAFFDVVKMPNRPFIVHSKDINIRVLGTSFNVRSYDDDSKLEATLFRGKIEVTRNNDPHSAPIIMRPNEKISIDREPASPASKNKKDSFSIKELAKVQTIDSLPSQDKYLETGWVYNRLEFRGDSFLELSKKLERWYNINISFEDEAVQSLRFNGSFENETAAEVFRALKIAIPFNYKITGHEVSISSAGK